jgi:hypothetical protein
MGALLVVRVGGLTCWMNWEKIEFMEAMEESCRFPCQRPMQASFLPMTLPQSLSVWRHAIGIVAACARLTVIKLCAVGRAHHRGY